MYRPREHVKDMCRRRCAWSDTRGRPVRRAREMYRSVPLSPRIGPVHLTARAVLALALAPAFTMAAPALRAQGLQYRSLAGVEHRSLADTGTIAKAAAALAAAPQDVDRVIALGLAQAAMRQYQEAIVTFTRGLAIAPANPLLYRWRGHRYISVGDPARALVDLRNGVVLDSTNYDIWYHIGVAHFLRGEFAAASDAFAHCQRLAPNANEVAGSADWLWMSLARAGRPADAQRALAPITDAFRVPTASAYFQRLQLYRGLRSPDQVITAADTADVQVATLSFGIGNWMLVRGDTAGARRWFERSVATGGWPGFGYFASEIELRRLR